MPKIKNKTNKSVAKRVKVTKNGKLKRHCAGHSHLLSKKSSKRRRNLRQPTLVSKSLQDKLIASLNQ